MLTINSNMVLPPEIWEHIFSFISFKQLLPLKSISRVWNGVIDNYFHYRNITLDINGYIMDSYLHEEYHFLDHFLEKKQYDRFRRAILFASKIGNIKPYLIMSKKNNAKIKSEFDDSWGNTDIINQIYLKAVHHNQIIFLDQFISQWTFWRYPTPEKPYSYEMAVWLHQHSSPQYPKLLSYFMEQHNPQADDLIKNGIVQKNNDYYFTLGKQGTEIDGKKVWYLYGLADGGYMELVNKMLDEYQICFPDTYQVCFYEKNGTTLLHHFINKINLDFLMEAFIHERLDICDVITDQYSGAISLDNFNWKHKQFISYLLNKPKLHNEIGKRYWNTNSYFYEYIETKVEINDLKLMFDAEIISPDILTTRLHRIAKRSLEIFLFVYNKLTCKYKCKILLRKKLYHAYEAIHPKCNYCQETVLPKIIKFVPRLIPYFIKTKSVIIKDGGSYKINYMVLPYHPNLVELQDCKLADIKKLLLLDYHQQTDPYQYYQNDTEMKTWLKANRIKRIV